MNPTHIDAAIKPRIIDPKRHPDGKSFADIAKEEGISHKTASRMRRMAGFTSSHANKTTSRIKESRRKVEESTPQPSETRPPLRSEVEEMRRAAASHDDDYNEPIEDVWNREEERCARAIRRARESSTFRWKTPNSSLLLAFISDMHIAPGTPVDFRKMREDAQLIRETPGCYAVLVGDQVDNHIKHRSAIIASRSQPEDQYRLFEYYLTILGERCLIVTSGNHDDWTNQYAGVDYLGRIVREKRVFYSPDEAWLEIQVGGQSYLIACRHQYRYNSSFNQTHTVKQWLRMGPREFDVGVIGHHHEAAIEQVIYRERFRWVARPGSYQITSAYSRQHGYNHSIPTCPTFWFAGDEYAISGWNSVRGMAKSVKAIQAMK